MPIIEIITGVAGSGKSERCRALLNEHPGAWLLLPSEELCARWRRRHPDCAAGIHTLPGLAHALAGPALDGREVVTPAFRLLIMRQIVREQVRPGDYFGKVAATAGFVRRLADLLSELKQREADAHTLAGAVRAAGPHAADATFVAKGEEIAALQRSYNHYLEERRLCDADDVIARAIGQIRLNGPGSNGPWPAILLVDGFFAFTPLQLSFLRALSANLNRLIVTLTHDTSRPVLFARSAETLARLRETFPTAAVTELPAGHRPATSLSLLERQFFHGGAPASPVDASVSLFEAPDELMQVEMVAREIRRLLDGQGYRPREICLLARSVADLAPPIKSVFNRYDIPVCLHVGMRLGENPFVAWVSALLRCWRYDWRRDDLLRVLRSSFLGLDRFAVDALERKARRLGLQHGRARWLDAGGAGESQAPIIQALQWLAEGQDRCSASRSPAEFHAALSQSLADRGLGATASPEPAAVQSIGPLGLEDLCAWESARNIMDDLSRLAPLPARSPWRCEEFVEAAMAGWAEGFYNLPANDEDQVQALEAYDARGQEFRAAFVLNLIEGVFPRQPHEDPFFRDDERQALARGGGISLRLSVAQADEERLLFYQAITVSRERLVLCYPKTDAGGRPTLRSFFLDEVDQALAPLPLRSLSLADAVPGPEEAALPRERLASLAAALGDGLQPDHHRAPESLRRLCAALREEQPDQVSWLLAARDSRRPYHLAHPAVLSHWSARRGTYTVSELEAVRACPFQHHLRYRLRIGGAVDGAGPLDQGTIVHEALRRFFSEIDASVFPEPTEALQRLQAICRALFDDTPLDAQPYRIRLAEGAVLRYMEGFIERELEYRQAARLQFAHLEWAFGPQGADSEGETGGQGDGEMGGTDAPSLPVPPSGRGPTDPASTRQPLVVRVGDTEVRLSGKIDRIDRTPEGCALVLDYKLGKALRRKEILEGKSLQMPVYWLAAEQLLGLIPVGGAYDALRAGQRPVIARCDLADHVFVHKGILGKNALGKAPFEQLLEQARAAIVEAAALIERLEVAPAPLDPSTCQYCSFKDCCRPEEAGLRFVSEAEEQTADA